MGRFPSPHSGILFLFLYQMRIIAPTGERFPSPHSGILFLCLGSGSCIANIRQKGFRPLIRGFFFYFSHQPYQLLYQTTPFPSPHSGILFLCDTVCNINGQESIGVSVPSFGDSFFIKDKTIITAICSGFPSPHSGILFLYCRYDMPPSLNIFAIFRRILHLLAQKGFSLTQSIHFSPYPSASARIKSFFIHIVPSPIPLNQYIITSSSFISPMPHDLTLVWS